MIYPEIIEIENRRLALKPKVSRLAMCEEAGMSDETYRLWLKGRVSPSLEKIHKLRAVIDEFESRNKKIKHDGAAVGGLS